MFDIYYRLDIFFLLAVFIRVGYCHILSYEVHTVNYEEDHMLRDHIAFNQSAKEENGTIVGMSRNYKEVLSQHRLNESEGQDYDDYVNITVYNDMMNDTWLNLVSVMDLFTQREYDNNSAIQALTAAYRYTLRQQTKLKTLPSYMKKPFIVIEGLDRENRNMLTKRLALHIQGVVIPNPPESFDAVYRHLPPNNTIINNGFFSLSTYIAALHVRYVTQKASAIIPGYWLGRAASTIAKQFIDKPPPYESKFWIWPKDLVKPDIVFYLIEKSHLHLDFKYAERYLKVFDNWDDPRCVPLVNTESIDGMMGEIDQYLQQI